MDSSVVKKAFMPPISCLCLHWEMTTSQIETVHGLDQSPSQLHDHITLEGKGKAGVVNYYQSLSSALYIESYVFHLSFLTQWACVKEIFHLFHSHWGKRGKNDYIYERKQSLWYDAVFIGITIKNFDLELCIRLIRCNLTCVGMYAWTQALSPLNKILFCMGNSGHLSCRKKH